MNIEVKCVSYSLEPDAFAYGAYGREVSYRRVPLPDGAVTLLVSRNLFLTDNGLVQINTELEKHIGTTLTPKDKAEIANSLRSLIYTLLAKNEATLNEAHMPQQRLNELGFKHVLTETPWFNEYDKAPTPKTKIVNVVMLKRNYTKCVTIKNLREFHDSFGHTGSELIAGLLLSTNAQLICISLDNAKAPSYVETLRLFLRDADLVKIHCTKEDQTHSHQQLMIQVAEMLGKFASAYPVINYEADYLNDDLVGTISEVRVSKEARYSNKPVKKYDGCSGNMSRFWRWLFYRNPPWEHCCDVHDQPYAVGGTAQQRSEADRELMICVTKKGHPIWAFLMWCAVRIGGHPLLPFPWRWGFKHKWPTYYLKEPK